jgi:hypothetical protein
MNTLDVKYELREDYVAHRLLNTFRLDCGRVVGMVGVHVMPTYAGLLEGVPDSKLDAGLIKQSRERVSSLFGERPVHVIPPKTYHLLTEGRRTSRWMPPVTYYAWLESGALDGSDNFASELVVIWFGERERETTLFETAKRALRHLAWEELAEGCELD